MAAEGTIQGSVVNVRSGPGADYGIQGNLLQDTRVEIKESSGEWYRVGYKSINGWVHSSLLKCDNPEIYLEVIKELINVRSGAGTSNSVTGQLKKGDIVSLLDINKDWYQVKTAEGIKGFVHSDLVTEKKDYKPELPQVDNANKKVEIIQEKINIRSGPGTNYAKIAQAYKGEIYAVIKDEGDWVQIQMKNGSNAYVAAFLVKELENSGSVQEKPADLDKHEQVPVDPLAAPTVILDGQTLSFEVEPVIESGRTLVPLRAIFEAMGAQVGWDNATRTVTATKAEITVILPLGSTKPTVNGEVWQLEVPAKIKQDRTLAPLRFVGEAFGGQVNWDGNTRTITIKTSGEDGKVEGKIPDEVTVAEAEVNLRSGPSTEHNKVDSVQNGESLTVIGERDGWFEVSRGGRNAWIAGWLVRSNSNEEKTDIDPDQPLQGPDDDLEEDVNINDRGDEDNEVEEGILAVSTRQLPEGYRLLMRSAKESQPVVKEEDDGLKIVYTFEGVKLKEGREEAYFFVENGKKGRIDIEGVSLDDTTWITINLPYKYKYEISSEEKGKRQIFLISSQIRNIQDISLNNGSEIIRLKSLASMEYREELKDNHLILELPGTYRGLARDEYILNGKGASTLTVEEFNNGESTRIDIELTEIEDYQINKSINGDAISIIFKPQYDEKEPIKEPVKPDKTTIIIDPGHGGRDSGAMSYTRNLMEKEVTLATGLKVRELLKEKGYNVVMTRDDDTFVPLKKISEIANQANADLFVSIHANGCTNIDANGTETYYYAPQDNKILFAQEYQRSMLADILQKSLMGKLGRCNRGVKQKNLSVLRETYIPASLVEIAFMTNPEEEKLLASSSFREKAAEAIAEGIEKYVKLML